ncbi:hypothetical protein TraAM80_00926 [Trypanosoma rangeli]|uniref:Uncharacterized protein n=1 Tax=Trypanosoma rangeli TaxID=5698 RepID=A0A3R7P212_TRYRA|nr:uncharacterized protein TraAM80_00926 [Trypanosoma rangeli]RNF11480.1 hypothetical protein TraAM80_00926 [Trypanosoma rangeli]|eukprot:RNF11480.1 hypothetical protein TraAM80_00926 [Trypanosoma rangeli]
MLCRVPAADEVEANVLYRKIEKLDGDLKKRELHLAELIDEVVYAEDSKDKAVRRAEAARYLVDQLEVMLQDLLGYLKVIEANILLPAFLELLRVVPHEPLTSREVVNQTLEKIAENSLSSRTKKLIATVRELPSGTQNRATREVFMRTVTEESVKVDDAIVLSGLLLANKDELLALLDDLKERVQYALQGNRPEALVDGRNRGVGSIKNVYPNIEELQDKLHRMEKERDKLREQMLSQGDNPRGINHILQGEMAAMEKQLSDACHWLSTEQSNSQKMLGRMKTLEKDVEQLYQEKEMLQREVKELRRDQVGRSRSYAEERREEELQQLKMELDRVMSGHAAACAATESQLADLRAQNAILLAEKQEYKERIDDKDHQIASLQVANDVLRRELFELQQKVLSSSHTVSANEDSEHVQRLEATVACLTTELNALERRLSDVSARHQDERKKIIAQFEEEHGRYKAERQECDSLVERMANELEQLAMDNRSLRAAAALQQL